MDIREIIKRDEYKFIHEEEKLGNNIILLTLGGSHAYGTNVEQSDVDIRGITNNTKESLLGFNGFEQIENKETDTVIYSLNKIIKLLMNCNPNTIEILGCREQDYTMVSDIGKKLLENKHMFLSQKCMGSFKGYATSQLRRLENSIGRNQNTQGQEEHIKKSINNALHTLRERYQQFDDGAIDLNVLKLIEENKDHEICIDINLKDFPLRDFKGMISEMTSIVNSYDELNHRNNKKSDYKLNKHAMHLLRLMLMCKDILTKQEIITYREKDLDLLMSVRNGDFCDENNKYKQSFFDLVDKLSSELDSAYRDTKLPKTPNYIEIEKMVMDMNMFSLLCY